MKFIAYDLGTGGVKASLYNQDLSTAAKSFIEYDTFYEKNLHEQKPSDWWNGVIQSTKILLEKSHTDPKDIQSLALSGHSCAAVPLDSDNHPLLEQVPIWSDTRATAEAADFFTKIDADHWYTVTGNGFPAPCYSLFKLMWYKRHVPDMFSKIHKILGSKDYINFMLTGNVFTDYSYASSTGAYDLENHEMHRGFLEAAGIPYDIYPDIVSSHYPVGTVTKEAAALTGLHPDTLVACGGVDNACMALGAVGTRKGGIYTSLGSSSWVPVNSDKPVLDPMTKPYTFAHIDESMYTSAFSIFAGGSSFRWIRETLCKDLTEDNTYDVMGCLAASIPIGADGLIFNPSLAGGTSQDKSPNIQGAFLGLNLGTTREHMIRAAMEGIALNLKMSVDYLKESTYVSDEILFCGGGSKSDFWMQMFADIFQMRIIRTNIDQDAASVGAAAICARASGVWDDYGKIESLHHLQKEFFPIPENVAKYKSMFPIFQHTCDMLADYGDYMKEKWYL